MKDDPWKSASPRSPRQDKAGYRSMPLIDLSAFKNNNYGNYRFDVPKKMLNINFSRFRYALSRVSPEKKIGALFAIAGMILAPCAFGFNGCSWALDRFCDFLSFCLTPLGFALSAFVTLGVVGVVAIFWTWKQLTSRFSYVQIGSVIALFGLALGLWAGGSLYYGVWMPQTQLIGMGVASAVLLIVGLRIAAIEDWQPHNRTSATNLTPRDTIYGDARSAVTHEIHKVARGQAGGFENCSRIKRHGLFSRSRQQ